MTGPRAVRRSITVLGLAAAILSLRPAMLLAQPQPIRGEVIVPGGVAAAREAFEIGGSQHRADAGWLLDVAHKYYDYSESNPAVATLQRYLDYLQAVSVATAAWPDGCQLVAASGQRDGRNRVRNYLELLGLRLKESRGRYTVEPDDDRTAQQHAGWLRAASIDVADLARRLTAGERVHVRLPQSAVPLPLPALWRSEAGDKPLVAAIAADRASMFLYAGLMSLDDETLTYLSGRPALVRQLREDVAPAFAAFGGAIRVRGDAVETPAGETALWESLVGRRVQPADRFLRELLSADAGRLAWFYDTIDHLDAARQRFALGAHLQDKQRLEFVRRVYKTFAGIDGTWKLPVRPFFRPQIDPSMVLAAIEVDGDQAAGQGWTPALLTVAVEEESWPDKPERLLKGGPARDRADAEWVLDWIFSNPRQARGRFALLRFAQRRLRAPAATPPADALLALMTFRDMPALALSLERMGVTDAAVFAAAGRRAHALTQSGGPDEAVSRLTRWQGAVGLLEQVQRRRHLPSGKVHDLVRALVAASEPSRTHPREALGAWTLDQLLPALGVDAGVIASEDVEAAALQAMSGDPAAEPVKVSWEGQNYLLDWAGATARSAAAIRASAPGPTLATLGTLVRIERQLAAGIRTLDEAHAAGAQLTVAQKALDKAGTDAVGNPPFGDVKDEARRLAAIKKASDLKKLAKLAPAIAEVADRVTTAVLGSLTYALAVSPTAQPPAVYAELFRKHRLVDADARDPFNDSAGVAIPWQRAVWQPPVSRIDKGAGAILSGALLLVDLAVAESQLRSLAADVSPSSAVLDPDAVALIQRVVHEVDSLVSGEAAARWAAAVKAGRQTLDTWRQSPPAVPAMRDAMRGVSVGDARIGVVLWELQHAGSAGNALTVDEIARLGGAASSDAAIVAGPLDACACLEPRPRVRQEEFGIRAGYGMLGGTTADLPVRLVELLADMGVSARLMPALLTGAVEDLRSHVRSFGLNDWDALAAWTRGLSRARVEEYLLGLQAARLLVPPASAGISR